MCVLKEGNSGDDISVYVLLQYIFRYRRKDNDFKILNF